MPDSSPLRLFIIYAREDQPALLEMKAHLRPLEKRGNLRVWYDGEILPGQNWDEAIKAQLATADIVLLFISKSFFNSEYIEKEELKKALERHQKGEATVVPVIVKSCYWEAHDEVAALQVLPKDGKPVSSWGEADEAWVDVVRGIVRMIEVINSKSKVAIKHEQSYDPTFLAKSTKRIKELYESKSFLQASIEAGFFKLTDIDLPHELCLVIGKIYFEGKGILKNKDEGIKWITKSANGGSDQAFIILGTIYMNGDGVKQDFSEAFRCYFEASRLGNSDAQHRLGIMYESGTGEKYDLQKAIEWYQRAEANGNPYATNALIRLGYKKA